ncbi:hypothetical protein SNOG_12335 [Parastagonospora nodorum SN15]|uniref:Uncharacterized protein n=1 Tax=Phaeosphaeria nodorum (strain SN15 / ATCC MYA-4574 / FGSC 10173) TaxID=321614 RepID=Q0U7C9_PHANO|nr:hypothetical protein SNOG_12335 [Parastagonospora nodorum SN15]EAT80148.1 hypothetical protein SNOG_12335 [Parastagonospora nodorum SN15]
MSGRQGSQSVAACILVPAISCREGHGHLVAVGRPLSPGVFGGGELSILVQSSGLNKSRRRICGESVAVARTSNDTHGHTATPRIDRRPPPASIAPFSPLAAPTDVQSRRPQAASRVLAHLEQLLLQRLHRICVHTALPQQRPTASPTAASFAPVLLCAFPSLLPTAHAAPPHHRLPRRAL